MLQCKQRCFSAHYSLGVFSLVKLFYSSWQLKPIMLFSSDLTHQQGVLFSSTVFFTPFCIKNAVWEIPRRSAVYGILTPAHLVPSFMPWLYSQRSEFFFILILDVNLNCPAPAWFSWIAVQCCHMIIWLDNCMNVPVFLIKWMFCKRCFTHLVYRHWTFSRSCLLTPTRYNYRYQNIKV